MDPVNKVKKIEPNVEPWGTPQTPSKWKVCYLLLTHAFNRAEHTGWFLFLYVCYYAVWKQKHKSAILGSTYGYGSF